MWWSMIMYLPWDVKQKVKCDEYVYTFFTNLILNERVYFFLSKWLGKLVLEDIYYKFSISFIVHIVILYVTHLPNQRKENCRKQLLKKMHLLRRLLEIYILFSSLLMLHIKFTTYTKMGHAHHMSSIGVACKCMSLLSYSIDWLIVLCFTPYR